MAEVLIFATQTIVKDPTLNDDVLLEEGGEIETQVAFFMETEKGKRGMKCVKNRISSITTYEYIVYNKNVTLVAT